MKVIKYNVEINSARLPYLVEESSYAYSIDHFQMPEHIVGLLNDVFRLGMKAEENVYMMALNAACQAIGIFEISHGRIDCSLCDSKQIAMRLLLCNAYGFVLAHNHPSGNCNPSKADIEAHEKIEQMAKLMGYKYFDNFVVCDDKYYSFKEKGLL